MNNVKRIPARFFESDTGKNLVREWLLDLSSEDRRLIGQDIATVEFGWPIGMPLCRSMKGYKGLWEIRVNLSDVKIARILFCAYEENLVLLHGFIKKSQKTPDREIEIAIKRMRGLR